MAKNTASSKFRNVDVDEFDTEKYQDDAAEDLSAAGINEAEINDLLVSKKTTEALRTALSNAPIGSKDQALKTKSFGVMLRILTSFKSSEVEAAVKGMDLTQLDLLMKYIYRGFANPTDNSSAVLLTWHEKVLAAAGAGSIVRVLTDRKGV